MCAHDPRLTFENIASTEKPGRQLYHAPEFVLRSRRCYHQELNVLEERSAFLAGLTANDRENAINYQDVPHIFYNWAIDEATLEGWCVANGFSESVFLNAAKSHKGAHHILARKR